MLVIPAIDIINGKVVRLRQGRTGKKVYSDDPVEVARKWAGQGAQLIHVVDLDGAIKGKTKNLQTLKDILKAVKIPLQFGGGLRDLKTIKKILDYGVFRAVLGTQAIEDRRFLKNALLKFGDRIIVSIDAQKGHIKTRGWRSTVKGESSIDFARDLKKMGFKELIYTNIARDGTLQGPDLKGVKSILKKVKMRVISSGGVSSLEDIVALKKLVKHGLMGVVVGKALYEKKFSLSDAIRCGY